MKNLLKLMSTLLVLCTLIITLASTQNTSSNFLIKTELNVVSKLDSTKFHGEDAGTFSAPWIVSIQLDSLYGDNKKLIHRCSGTIIKNDFIVTSDQCVTNLPEFSQIIIFAGIFNLDEITEGSDAYKQVRYPKQIIRHSENIRSSYYINDIALIKLNFPFVFNNRIQPINLLPLSQMNLPKIAFQFGWSYNKKSSYHSDLQVNIKNLSKSFQCENIRGRLSVHDICTESLICNTADHGSPLILIDENSIARLYGIWSFDYCEESAVSIFTSVQSFHSWILPKL